MADPNDLAERFLALHHQARPLLLPNPWDQGSAKLFASLGFEALATTSSGFAATLGRPDGAISRAEALEHAALVVAATKLPVTADLENCFADDAAGVAATVAMAAEIGLAGCSIEDFSGSDGGQIYELDVALERVRAAAEAARNGSRRVILTARAENHLHGRNDLGDTIARLKAYEEAGADVLYAPGVTERADIERLVQAVDLPINVLALPGTPNVAELAELGVARVSVGSGFALVAMGAVAEAGRELLESGTYEYWATAGIGHALMAEALVPVV